MVNQMFVNQLQTGFMVEKLVKWSTANLYTEKTSKLFIPEIIDRNTLKYSVTFKEKGLYCFQMSRKLKLCF